MRATTEECQGCAWKKVPSCTVYRIIEQVGPCPCSTCLIKIKCESKCIKRAKYYTDYRFAMIYQGRLRSK